VLSLGFNALVRGLFRTGLADHQVGLKALRVDVAMMLMDQIRTDGFFFDTELIVNARKMGVRIGAVDVLWRDKRIANDSKVPPIRALITMFADLLALRISLINGRRLIGLTASDAGVLHDITCGVTVKATRLYFSTKNRRFLNFLSKLYFLVLFGSHK
ncbi:MAG: hypothetical protein QW613_07395, partial [Thermoprotei archaeon]